MPSNYNTLLSSENDLSMLFFDSLDQLMKTNKYLWKNIFSTKIDDELNEKINYYTDISLKYSKDILDDCIWIISKDQPRANHLRYIISMIYSVKDIEALTKYPSKIIFGFNKKIKLSKDLENLTKDYLLIFEKMITLLKQKNVEDTYEKSKILKDKFSLSYDLFIKKIMIKQNNNFDIETYRIVKYLDKGVDHLFNLFDNFKFIKNNKKKIL